MNIYIQIDQSTTNEFLCEIAWPSQISSKNTVRTFSISKDEVIPGIGVTYEDALNQFSTYNKARLKQFGAFINRRIFNDDRLSSQIGAILGLNNEKLRIIIQLSNKVKYLGIPFEAMWDHSYDMFYSRIFNCSIIRYSGSAPTSRESKNAIYERLPKTVFCYSTPDSKTLKKFEDHYESVEALFNDDNVLARCYIESSRDLLKKISRYADYDIFYFIAHGDIGVFDLEKGGITGEMLHEATQLTSFKVIYLNSCLSSASDSSDMVNNAYRLSKAGCPIVIGMQSEIGIPNAIRMGEIFFKSIISGKSIEHAVALSRLSINELNPRFGDFIAPTLYMNTLDTIQFKKSTVVSTMDGEGAKEEQKHALRLKDILIHFLNRHYLQCVGLSADSISPWALREIVNCLKIALLICKTRILLPAPSFTECAYLKGVLDELLPFSELGLINFPDKAANPVELAENKVVQYSPAIHLVSAYQLAATNLDQFNSAYNYNLYGKWIIREAGSGPTMRKGWVDLLEHGAPIIEQLYKFRKSSLMPADFDRAIAAIPDMLGKDAFIIDFLKDYLPVNGVPRHILLAVGNHIDDRFILSYLNEFDAVCIKDLPRLDVNKGLPLGFHHISFRTIHFSLIQWHIDNLLLDDLLPYELGIVRVRIESNLETLLNKLLKRNIYLKLIDDQILREIDKKLNSFALAKSSRERVDIAVEILNIIIDSHEISTV